MHRRDARAEREGGIATPRAGRARADGAVFAPGQEAAEEQRPVARQHDMYRIGGRSAHRDALFGRNRDVGRIGAARQLGTHDDAVAVRSEKGRVGKEWVKPWNTRWE